MRNSQSTTAQLKTSHKNLVTNMRLTHKIYSPRVDDVLAHLDRTHSAQVKGCAIDLQMRYCYNDENLIESMQKNLVVSANAVK